MLCVLLLLRLFAIDLFLFPSVKIFPVRAEEDCVLPRPQFFCSIRCTTPKRKKKLPDTDTLLFPIPRIHIALNLKFNARYSLIALLTARQNAFSGPNPYY